MMKSVVTLGVCKVGAMSEKEEKSEGFRKRLSSIGTRVLANISLTMLAVALYFLLGHTYTVLALWRGSRSGLRPVLWFQDSFLFIIGLVLLLFLIRRKVIS
jgi:multidrug transporter EmrE-like cation transporter